MLPIYAAILRTARERLGLTQAEVASKLRCSLVTYQDWEDGKYPPHPRYLRKLCEVLHIAPKDLMDALNGIRVAI